MKLSIILSLASITVASAQSEVPIRTYTLGSAKGPFSYTVLESKGYREPWSEEKAQNVAKTEEQLLAGDPDLAWDDGKIVDTKDAWSSEENLHYYNCHTYTFRDLVEIQPWEWLNGFSSERYPHPIEPILDHLCEPIILGLPTGAEGVAAIEKKLNEPRADPLGKWIFTLGFYPVSSDLPQESKSQEWFRHSGELFLENGRAFARSKIGEGHILDAYLQHVVDLYVQIHAMQKIPDLLGLSVYECVPAQKR